LVHRLIKRTINGNHRGTDQRKIYSKKTQELPVKMVLKRRPSPLAQPSVTVLLPALTPIVSWNPQMEFILKNTLEGGLIKEEKEGKIKWNWGYEMQNTIMFHLYKQIAKRHNLNPRQFYGILPIELIYYYIKYPDASEKAFAEIMKERIVSAD
jgi:hypothetical protein